MPSIDPPQSSPVGSSTRITRLMRFGLGLILVVVAGGLAVTDHILNVYLDTTKWVIHTHEVIESIEEELSLLTDAETGMRGYLLTGDEAFLEPHLNATLAIQDAARRIRDLTKDDLQQQTRLDAMDLLIKERMAQIDGFIALRREKGKTPAVEDLRKGKTCMDAIRRASSEIQDWERVSLRERTSVNEGLARRSIVAGATLGVTVLLLLSWLYILLIRHMAGRQRAEMAARDGEERVRLILASSAEAIYGIDLDGRCTFANERCLRMLGYGQVGDLLGREMHALIHHTHEDGSPYPVDACPIYRAFREGVPTHVKDEVLWRADGTGFHSEFWSTPMVREGRIVGAVVNCIDITDRRRAEADLDRYFQLSLDLACVAGLDGCFKRLNPAWTKTLGFSAEELMARPYIEFVHPDDRASTLAEAGKLAQGVDVVSFENRYQSKSGSWRWLGWTARAPRPGEAFAHATARDITERKEAEERIQLLNLQLEERIREATVANQELEAFSHSVSHDLRAPLRHISGFVDLLQKTAAAALDEKARRQLGVISDSAKRMGQLIDDLLAFSRTGRVEMRRTTVSLDAIAEDVRRVLEPETRGRRIEWSIAPLPAVTGDPSLLRQVVLNLLSNAVKYSRQREVARIELGFGSADGEEPSFFVRDNGAGFEMQYANKLFGVFQRLHAAHEFEGTGIGLANVRRIVQRHGGKVWAQGRVGEGATFRFTLPLAREDES